MDVFLSIAWFLLRIILCLGTFIGVISLFIRYPLGGYYTSPFGDQRWPIWSTPGKIPFRERPYTTRPPKEIAGRFKYSNTNYKWELTVLWGWIFVIVLLVSIALTWWFTGYIATLF